MENRELYYQEIKNNIQNTTNFLSYNKMNIDLIKDNYVQMSLDITDETLNNCQIVHGGLLFSLADAAMSLAAKTNGKETVTISANINYLKAVQGKKVKAVASLIKKGKATSYYKCQIFNDEDVLCATVTGIYYFLEKEDYFK